MTTSLMSLIGRTPWPPQTADEFQCWYSTAKGTEEDPPASEGPWAGHWRALVDKGRPDGMFGVLATWWRHLDENKHAHRRAKVGDEEKLADESDPCDPADETDPGDLAEQTDPGDLDGGIRFLGSQLYARVQGDFETWGDLEEEGAHDGLRKSAHLHAGGTVQLRRGPMSPRALWLPATPATARLPATPATARSTFDGYSLDYVKAVAWSQVHVVQLLRFSQHPVVFVDQVVPWLWHASVRKEPVTSSWPMFALTTAFHMLSFRGQARLLCLYFVCSCDDKGLLAEILQETRSPNVDHLIKQVASLKCGGHADDSIRKFLGGLLNTRPAHMELRDHLLEEAFELPRLDGQKRAADAMGHAEGRARRVRGAAYGAIGHTKRGAYERALRLEFVMATAPGQSGHSSPTPARPTDT